MYRTFIHSLVTITQTEGLFALYRGNSQQWLKCIFYRNNHTNIAHVSYALSSLYFDSCSFLLIRNVTKHSELSQLQLLMHTTLLKHAFRQALDRLSLASCPMLECHSQCILARKKLWHLEISLSSRLYLMIVWNLCRVHNQLQWCLLTLLLQTRL